MVAQDIHKVLQRQELRTFSYCRGDYHRKHYQNDAVVAHDLFQRVKSLFGNSILHLSRLPK